MKLVALRVLVATALTAAVCALAQQVTGSTQTVRPSLPPACDPNATYTSLTADLHKASALTIAFGKAPIELTISWVEGCERLTRAKTQPDPALYWDELLWRGVNVSSTGEIASFADGRGSARGGGGGKLGADAFARLKSLMENLPEDSGRVPPPNRRVTIRVERNGKVSVRLYDTARLPDQILEMLRLTGASLVVPTPVFHPGNIWTPDEARKLNLLVPARQYNMSHDGTIGVLHDFVTKTLTVFKETSRTLNGGMPDAADTIHTIGEFWQPPEYGGYSVDTEFSADDQYLLVTCEPLGVLLYDTKTWQPVTDPHLFPQNLAEYFPSLNWEVGLAETASGETMIWNAKEHRVISRLAGLKKVQTVAFSSNGAKLAIYSGPRDQLTKVAPNEYRLDSADLGELRLSVWDVASGKRLHELWPVASTGNSSMTDIAGEPVWWNGGRWLLTGHSMNGGKGLWDAKTGRFLGTFDTTGCRQPADDVLVASDKLFQRCAVPPGQPSGVLEWSAEAVQKQITNWQSGQDINP